MQECEKVSNINQVFDRLYGIVELGDNDLKLFQTRELTRLRQVSLSAIPPWTLPTGTCATRFEHSVGVGHLARIVGQRPEFAEYARDLYFAALAHDLGTPPFSHASEHFQVQILGKNHEQFIEDVVDNSEFANEVVKQGGSIDRIVSLVKGQAPPISDLINGSIDLDNLDNSLRYGLSMGIIPNSLYSPEELVKAYALHDGKLFLLPGYAEHIQGWEQTRNLVYEFVYSHVNLSPGMMLFRALDLAAKEGELPREYYFMTDVEASQYLKNNCNQRTKTLVERVERWIFYSRIFNFITSSPSEGTRQLCENWENRKILADEISGILKIAPEDICVYVGQDKGYKEIHLPTLNHHGDEKRHIPLNKQSWMAQVYIHPSLIEKTQEISVLMRERLKVR